MIDTINILTKKLFPVIPSEILHLAFEPDKAMKSLDAVIREKVIIDMVLMNINLYAGRLKKLTVYEHYRKEISETEAYNPTPGDFSVYQIPMEMTENKQIVSVIDIAYPHTLALSTSYPHQNVEGRSVLNGATEALGSFTNSPITITPVPVLCNNNIIRYEPPLMLHVDMILTCLLEYSETMDDMASNQIEPLFKCTLYATQMYIYNKLIIQLNQGYLAGGLQLEAVKNIVDTYSDAHEKFDEAIKIFRGSATLEKTALVTLLSEMLGS